MGCKAKLERCIRKVSTKGKSKESARKICAASIFKRKRRV